MRALARRGITQAIEPDIHAALELLRTRLRHEYEDAIIDEVFEWGLRYFIRDFAKWNAWSIVLVSIANNIPRGLDANFRSSSYAWLARALQVRYGKSARAELHRVAAEAAAIPLSAIENDMVIIDAGSRDPGDPELVDVIEDAMSIARLHRAYTFWRELKNELSDLELQLLVEVARHRAKELPIGPVDNPLTTGS